MCSTSWVTWTLQGLECITLPSKEETQEAGGRKCSHSTSESLILSLFLLTLFAVGLVLQSWKSMA